MADAAVSVGGPDALFLSRHPEIRQAFMVLSLMVGFHHFSLGLRKPGLIAFSADRGDASHSPKGVRGRTDGP